MVRTVTLSVTLVVLSFRSGYNLRSNGSSHWFFSFFEVQAKVYISKVLRNILAAPSSVLFCNASVLMLIPIFFIHMSNFFEIMPSAPITIGMTSVFFIPQRAAISRLRSWYFSTFSCSLFPTRTPFGTAMSMILHSFFFFSTTTISGLRL